MLMIRGFKSYLNVDVDDISRINVAKEEVYGLAEQNLAWNICDLDVSSSLPLSDNVIGTCFFAKLKCSRELSRLFFNWKARC
ncbi:hypothetical protein QE152_g8397 [Popillia japonica]|uniref:Uncharacterized protein n=1 Tax=Popillia japonica TaxID=7064 RepID=A0AAW1MBV9_POPJA